MSPPHDIPGEMLAIRVHASGGPDALRAERVPTPHPGPGEALVRLAAAGVNFVDVYQRSGLYPVRLPTTPGGEGAGVVAAVGEGVGGVDPGDRVAWAMVPGAYAEYAVVPVARLVPVPDDLDLELAAAVMLQGMTAHFLASSAVPLHPGDRVLVHAAAGGVGLMLVQIAKMRGAFVIGTAGTDEKADLARNAGADEVIVYTRDDFAAEVDRITGGEGVRAVYDSVGRSTFNRGLDVLSPRGAMVLFGQSSGPVDPIDPQVLNRKGSIWLTRPSLTHYIADRGDLERRSGDLFRWIREGLLRVRIGARYPLEEAPAAHRALEGRRTAGKVLLIPRLPSSADQKPSQ